MYLPLTMNKADGFYYFSIRKHLVSLGMFLVYYTSKNKFII